MKRNKGKMVLMYFLITLYNYIFIPLQLAFEIQFTGAILMMEVITILVFLLRFVQGSYRYNHETKPTPLLYIVRCTLAAFPFALIFSTTDTLDPRSLIVIVSLLRLNLPKPLVQLFRYLSNKKMTWNDALRILQVLFIYLLLAHSIACMWIEISKVEDDKQKSWMRRIPVP
jgi:hypothetical protein